MFRDESCFSLDRTFIVCDQGERVVDGIWEAGGYSLRWGFLTKNSQPFTVEINLVSLDRTIGGYHFASRI